jgi:hypothetical protein
VTSRDTVDGDRSNPPAIWRNDWPATRPREISSRSAGDNRNGDRFRSRGAGRDNANTARRIACRDRCTSSHNRQNGTPSNNNSAIRSRSFADSRSTHGLPDPEPNKLNDAMTT